MDNPSPSPANDEAALRRRLVGYFLFPIALFPFLALVSYDWHDMAQLCIPPHTPSANLIGIAGDTFAYASFRILGLAAWVIPFLCVFVGLLLILGRRVSPGRRTLGLTLFTLALTCLMQLMSALPSITAYLHALNIEPDAGGALGHLVMTRGLSQLLSPFGAGVLMILLMIFALFFTIGFRNLIAALGRLTAWAADRHTDDPAREAARADKETERAAVEAARAEVRRQKEEAKIQAAAAKAAEKAAKEAAREEERRQKEEARLALIAAKEAEQREREAEDAALRARLTGAAAPAADPYAEREAQLAAREKELAAREAALATHTAPVEPPAPAPAALTEAAETPPETPAEDKGPYVLPPPEKVLNPVPTSTTDHGDVEAMEQRIVDTLRVFHVDVTPAYRVTGPVVTQYALTPAPGVKAERVANLSANLQMALEAKSLRILSPIPGKNAVGIEVPNLKPATVSFREVIDGELWRTKTPWPEKGQPKFHIPLLLGKDAAGNDLVVDLAKMPHLLVAGATGQGKSVCLNSIINGLLMCRTPEQLKFIMVDPKRVEFTSYNKIPHLLVPVINDTKKVVFGLRWAVVEMEKRLKLFARVGAKNIVDFNTRKRVAQGDLFGGEEIVSDPDMPATLPYIVIIVDEVADVMQAAQKEVEPVIARLTALARATGIHLILATQRPDTKVITGTIKSNIPGRIAFKTSSAIDSRTILDSPGSEDLIGRGDMLFRTSEGLLVRAQGSWISDDEIGRIINFIGEHSSTQFDEKLADRMNRIKEADPNEQLEDDDNGDAPVPVNTDETDPLSTLVTSGGVPPPKGMTASKEEQLFLAALDVLASTGRASTSHLQRRMGIGYNHAARLIDLLEDRGIVGPARGAGPRELLLDPEAIRQMALGNPAPAADAAPATMETLVPETPPDIAVSPFDPSLSSESQGDLA